MRKKEIQILTNPCACCFPDRKIHPIHLSTERCHHSSRKRQCTRKRAENFCWNTQTPVPDHSPSLESLLRLSELSLLHTYDNYASLLLQNEGNNLINIIYYNTYTMYLFLLGSPAYNS